MIQRALLRLVFFLCLSFLWTSSAFAADFSFDYDVTYTIAAHGTTRVKQAITITNNVTHLFAQNYSLTIASERIDNVVVTDPLGPIEPELVKQDGQTIITVPFNAKSVGIGKELPFVIEYDTRDIAKKNGRIWEIIIPGLEETEEINSYTIQVSVPPSFGKTAYVTPIPSVANTWTLDEHKGKGITVAFGDFQNFGFNLKYHLENTSGGTELQEITLPPDTAFQKVVISRISHVPQNVTTDRDGNWLAQFSLSPKEKKDIIVEGNVLIYNTPQFPTKSLSEADFSTYTQPQKYWEQTEAIKAKAAELKTPRAIYDYVVETLTYDYERVSSAIDRFGAAHAFLNPTDAVCMEFSDLFVALARAAGIPAREVHGYAYTTNSRLQPLSLTSDVLHAWPEYYDTEKRLWIPVDPTWGNTTRGVDYFDQLDFNHIAFAILGQHSDYPFPAGSFRNDTSTKDVFVDFSAEQLLIPEATFSAEIVGKKEIISGLPAKKMLRIYNKGTVLYQPASVSVHSKLLKSPVQLIPGSIPPYGYIEIPLELTSSLQLTQTSVPIGISIDSKNFDTSITVIPFYASYPVAIVGAVAIFLLLFGILKIYGKKRLR